MSTPNPSRPVRINKTPYRVIMPTLAGGILTGASLLLWLRDPLGKHFSAWQLPIDIGWQLHSGIFNYGLLCCCEALFAFWIAVQAWPSRVKKEVPTEIQTRPSLATCCTIAGLLCLLPPTLLLIQYLYADMESIARFTNHEIQARLIKTKFGYASGPQFLPIQITSFDPITLHGRVALLVNQIGGGSFLPLLSALILLVSRQLFPQPVQPDSTRAQRTTIWGGGLALFLLILLGRAPAAMACNYQAQHLLAEGDYSKALIWLNRAEKLNPSLTHLPSYHIERGHAWYFLHPGQPTTDSRAYLAAFYRQQNDYFSSYQELLAARQHNPKDRWVLDEFALTLQRLAETSNPLNGAPKVRIIREQSALNWLYQLAQADPGNVYAHYLIGGIKYDLHDYSACEAEMFTVLNLNQENDIESSAYTYLALSRSGQGDLITSRHYLFKAQELDPAYRNNTARQGTSGLR